MSDVRSPGLGGAVCRILIALHPRAVRERYGHEIWEITRARARDTPDSRRWAFWARESVALVRSAFDARIDAWLAPARRPTPDSGGFMELVREMKQTIRALRRQPGFVVTALLTLALAIGINTAVFSVVQSILLEPLPFPDSNQIVRVREVISGGEGSGDAGYATAATFHAWREKGETIEAVASYAPASFTVFSPDGPIGAGGAWVTPSIFPMLRAAALQGRVFEEADARPGGRLAALIGEKLFREHFGADPDLIGRVLQVEGMECVVVGVMPGDFYFPDRASEVWIGFVLPRPEFGTPGGSMAHPTLARLKEGVTLAAGEAEATLAANRGHLSKSSEGRKIRLVRLQDEMVGGVRPALLVIAAAVGLILLIGVANLSNLFLVRSARRQRELSVRVTLGASQRDLVRGLLAEGLLLSGLGGLMGVGLALATMRALPSWLPAGFPRVEELALDWTSVAFAAGLSMLTGVVCSIFPALRTRQVDPIVCLRDGVRSDGRSPAISFRLQQSFIVVQVALALVLLVGAGLLIRSFSRLLEVDPGYEPANVVTATLKLPGNRYKDDERWERARELAQLLETDPRVDSVGLGTGLPLSPGALQIGIAAPGGSGRKEDQSQASLNIVRPAYARALRLRLAVGRFLEETDTADVTPVVVVNEAFVKAYLGREPVGQSWPGLLEGKTWQIVGVVRDVRYASLDSGVRPEVYVSDRQARAGNRAIRNAGVRLAIRTRGDVMGVAAALPGLVRRLDPGMLLGNVATMEHRISASIAAPRLYAGLLGALATLATGLASLGLYGVLAYTVAQRRREIGVRLAVGASRIDILRLIYRDGLRLVLVGAVLGTIGATWLTQYLSSLLYAVDPHDLVTFAFMPLVLVAVASAACALPALRAARLDPLSSLRVD